ncbi:hypothetical protein RE6C_00467 [Rhodopirellula europaea 6C]|uniref:Uncharacterized protein n=1 Tax=Rhodopirellula europaea 6C TaxID=1263867 RepID=M2B9J8_9BACT|nr:hypothetical protein RE6C_00467 [Rhodopirellula europaea 6C]
MFALPSITKSKNDKKRQSFKQQQKDIASRHAAFMDEAVSTPKSCVFDLLRRQGKRHNV